MNAPEILEQLTKIHSALWQAHHQRISENGDDDIAAGLASSATYVGSAATTLSNVQRKMAAHYALHDALTGNRT